VNPATQFAFVPVPLCLTHNERMKVAAALDGYCCPVDGCTQHYNTVNGHFRLVNAVIEKRIVQRCTECTAHLYLAERGEIRLDDVWVCPNVACPSKRT
jgi:hypothetical protein